MQCEAFGRAVQKSPWGGDRDTAPELVSMLDGRWLDLRYVQVASCRRSGAA